MAGRHRRTPAWRRLLSSLVRSRDRVLTAALQAEVVALRATVAELRTELAAVQADAAAAAATAALVPEPVAAAEPGWVTLRMPLVRLALGDPNDVAAGPEVAAALASPDRSPDTAETEIVLEPAPMPADRLAWSVLAHLPERPLLDPRSDRDAEPRDPAAEATGGRESAGHSHRRTA
jgi:hypothetical protein